MNSELSFIKQYMDSVRSADMLKIRPARIKDDTARAIEDIDIFANCFAKALPSLMNYPSLLESLYARFENNAITGYIGEFMIEDAIAQCDLLSGIEQGILSKLETIGNASVNVDKTMLSVFERRAKSWRRIVNIDNLALIRRFLEALQQQVNELYEALSVEEKLGQALAQSEQERKRLIEKEEARRRGISEHEQEKEEKRRLAIEEFKKSVKTRKKI